MVSPIALAGLLTSADWCANNGRMTKDQAIKALGGTQAALATALGMTQGSVSLWGEFPPPMRQLQIEAMTRGELRAESDCDRFRFPIPEAASGA